MPDKKNPKRGLVNPAIDLPDGEYSTLARKLGVSPQHVHQVAQGHYNSKRVRSAVVERARRIRDAQNKKSKRTSKKESAVA